jgi:lysophospholipase L1-like esterase
MHCSNLYPLFAKTLTASNYTDYSWPLDGHFNAKGYSLFAKLAVEAIMSAQEDVFITSSKRHE